MRAFTKIGLVGAAAIVAIASWRIPRFSRADDLKCTFKNPFETSNSTQPTTAPGWRLENPDHSYAIAADICPGLPNSALAAQAMSRDPDQAKAAIEQLRAAGQGGLDALIDANKTQVLAHRLLRRPATQPLGDANWPKITAAIDAVAMQHDAYTSGLYWYTDLAAAQTAARSQGKPILSLHLHGNLNDENSCSTSRWIRKVLYANSEVSKYLREHFIMHWESSGPVPIITIDFGDGRVVRGTMMGNCIHYVLTPDGHVVDGIPGLYAPNAFMCMLQAAEAVTKQCLQQSLPDQTRILADWHSRVFEDSIKRFEVVLDASSRALMSAQLASGESVHNFENRLALDTVRNEYLLHQQIHRWLADTAKIGWAQDVSTLDKKVYAELFAASDAGP